MCPQDRRKVVFALSDSMCLCCGVHESEDVVQDVEASVIALELESLCEAHGLVLASKLGRLLARVFTDSSEATNQKGTGHEDKNAIVSRRLRIYGVGAVLNSLEWQVLSCSALARQRPLQARPT